MFFEEKETDCQKTVWPGPADRFRIGILRHIKSDVACMLLVWENG